MKANFVQEIYFSPPRSIQKSHLKDHRQAPAAATWMWTEKAHTATLTVRGVLE